MVGGRSRWTGPLPSALWAGFGLHGGRAPSYFGAASLTSRLNRGWTFRGAARGNAGRHRALFVAVNLIGFALNYRTHAVLVTVFPVVATGSAVGLAGNFLASRRFVFRGT